MWTSKMILHRKDSQIISVRSTNPEGVDDARRGFADFYHYLLTRAWPVLTLQLMVAFLLLNALFGVIYYSVGGITNAYSYLDAFFFSIETMTTIGYGRLVPVSLVAHSLM